MKPNETDQTTTPNGDAAGQEALDTAASQEAGAQAELDPVAVLEAEKAELKEKLLRILADFENLRRRTERELADARIYAVSNFARDMLTVADNVRRALDSVPAEARDGEAGPLQALVEGLELTERDLLNTLERYGVKKLDPEGQRFDPNLHHAVFEVPNPEVPSGTVVQVVQSGYVIGERVLRPALVGVAKGGPKPANGGQAQATTEPGDAR
jgi:molecular chaperone GrpE